MADVPGNVTGENMAVSVSPLFISKRYAGMQEFKVPNSMYNKMRYGRSSGARWAGYVTDPEMQTNMRAAFHGDGKFLITDELTGVSSIVKKMIKRNVLPDTMGE